MKAKKIFLKKILKGSLASLLLISGVNFTMAGTTKTTNDPEKITTTPTVESEYYSKHMSAYSSIEEVLKDFSFWGAIDKSSIELVEKNENGETKKQLKFRITDRRIPSGFSIKPEKAVLGEKMRIEMCMIPDEKDREIRFGDGRNNRTITAGWRIHIKDMKENVDYIPGVNPANFNDYQMQGFYPGYENLATADASFEPKGFVNDWFFYCTSDNQSMKPNSNVPGGSRPLNDLYKRHAGKINPSCNYIENPERGIVKQLDILIGGSTYKLWESASNFSGYDESTGFPKAKEDYDKAMNFQGEVYITYIEWGDASVD